jgi:sec-independent protein translocase protein TatA
MPSLGPAEILVVLVIALLVFGPNKMPDIARQVGKGFREFKRVQQHLKSELRDVVSEFDAPSSTPSADPVPMLPPKEEPVDSVASDAPASAVPSPAPAESASASASAPPAATSAEDPAAFTPVEASTPEPGTPAPGGSADPA